MIDVHSHILPNVDDGSDSLEVSIELVKEAIKLGISDIVFTPHYELTPTRVKPDININEVFAQFKDEVAKNNLNINVYLGNEITIDEKILDELKNKKCLSLNGTKYILLELDFYSLDLDIGEFIYEASLLGYHIIIAHVERYIYTNYKYVEMLVREGALIQINAVSLFSKDSNMKKLIIKLIKNNLVHFIASDVHSGRDNKMLEAYQLILKKFGREKANLLFEENPRKVLLNEDI